MSYAITGPDDSTEVCKEMAKDDDRKVSDFLRHLVKKEARLRKQKKEVE